MVRSGRDVRVALGVCNGGVCFFTSSPGFAKPAATIARLVTAADAGIQGTSFLWSVGARLVSAAAVVAALRPSSPDVGEVAPRVLLPGDGGESRQSGTVRPVNDKRKGSSGRPGPRGGGQPRDGRSRGGSDGGARRGRQSDAKSDRSRRDGARREQTRRSRDGHREESGDRAKRPPALGSETLPRWVTEELTRVTPRNQIVGATRALEQAALLFAGAKYGRALRHAEEAKALSPRDATVREVIGLSAYRLGKWDQALRELRTFRRLTGEATHLPVEMDVLRALERGNDVEEAWRLLRKLGGRPETQDEGRVVYASYLLDADRAREAWKVVEPGRLVPDPGESRLRVWYVAARAAVRLGDLSTARKLYQAVQQTDPAFPGLDELGSALER